MSVVHREDNFNNIDNTQGESISFSNKNDGTQYELQHIYRHNLFDLTIGMNYLTNQSGQFKFDIGSGSQIFNLNNDSKHFAFYTYTNIKPSHNLLMTFGFTQDYYKQVSATDAFGPVATAELRREPLNPKFGLTWNLSKNTTLRFAAFRSLKRGIIQNQTIEPTQVAGFNQFFDDIDGSIARRIGLGLDHKFNNNFFIGAEASTRYLDVPFYSLGSSSYDKTKWNENNARAYANWTPKNNYSFGIEYSYEKLNRNSDFFDTANNNSNFFTKLETHRIKFLSSFYHLSGFLSKINLSYVNQMGDFLDTTGSGLISQNESKFWLLDAEIGYRLQKRHGIITMGVKNILNTKFNFQGTDINYPSLPQGILLFSRITLSF